jgi:hypothetical protein
MPAPFTTLTGVFKFVGAMNRKRRDLILHKGEHAIAYENKCTLAEVRAVFYQHPIEINKERYLRRELARALLLAR